MSKAITERTEGGTLPDEWRPPKAGTFVKETMNDLADLGERLGADPNSWLTEPPTQ